MPRRLVLVGSLVLLGCSAGEGGSDDGATPWTTLAPGTHGDTSTSDGPSTGAADGTTTAITSASPTSSTTAAVDGTTDAGDTTTGGTVPPCPAPGAPLDCSPGPGSGNADTCVDDPSCYLSQVQGAVNGTIADNPTWFDHSTGQPYVLEVESYMNEVVARMNQNHCSIRDPNAGDEMVVKHDNAFAENFDILTADGFARYGNGIYTSKCIPAWF